MKEGRYGEGLLAGVEEVRKVLVGESTLEAEEEADTNAFVITVRSIWWFFSGLICAFFLHSQQKESQKATSFYPVKQSVGNLDFFMGTIGLLTCQFPVVLFYFLFRLFFRKWLHPPIKCEQCGAVGRFTQEKGYPTKKKEEERGGKWLTYHYVCRDCGHVREEKFFKEGWFSGSSRRDSSDGSSSSWSSGGSSSGGSWGGGSSGGGGTSSRF